LYAEKKKALLINQLFYLQHFPDGWENGKWEEKYKFENCIHKPPYRLELFFLIFKCICSISTYTVTEFVFHLNNYRETKDGAMKGWFWGYDKIQVRNVSCVSFQGHVNKLLPILLEHSKISGNVIMIDRGEIPLHDDYGGVDYWKVISISFKNTDFLTSV
jgi:hypothetical protein